MKKNENIEKSIIEFYGEELLNLRKQKGLSQEELADKLNVSRQSIHLWESGKIIPDVENIIKICNVLDITTDKISKGLDVIKKENTEKSKYKLKGKILKYLLIFISVFLLLYIAFSIRKSLILMKISEKVNNYQGINNYNYIEKQYLIKKDNSLGYNYKVEIYYKDGIRKQNFIDMISRKEEIIYEDFINNIRYNFNITNKTMEKDLNYNITHNQSNVLPIGVSEMILVGNDYKVINFLLGFNPFLSIESNEDEYILKWSYKKIDASTIKIKEKINKETGLITEKYSYNAEETSVIQYEIKINCTTEKDIEILNIDEFKIL